MAVREGDIWELDAGPGADWLHLAAPESMAREIEVHDELARTHVQEHVGPGPHPSGSEQAAHGGGKAAGGRKRQETAGNGKVAASARNVLAGRVESADLDLLAAWAGGEDGRALCDKAIRERGFDKPATARDALTYGAGDTRLWRGVHAETPAQADQRAMDTATAPLRLGSGRLGPGLYFAPDAGAEVWSAAATPGGLQKRPGQGWAVIEAKLPAGAKIAEEVDLRQAQKAIRRHWEARAQEDYLGATAWRGVEGLLGTAGIGALAVLAGYDAIRGWTHEEVLVLNRSALEVRRAPWRDVRRSDGELVGVREALERLPAKIAARYARRGSGPGRPRRVLWSRIWGSPDQRAYEQAVLAATAAINNQNDAAVLRIFSLLADYRADISSQLLALGGVRGDGGDGDSFETFHLNQLIGAIDAATHRFRLRYGAAMADELLRSWRAGGDFAPWVFERAGVSVPIMGLSPFQIEAALSYSARLVQHVTDDVRRKIDNAVYTGVMGRRSNFEIMQELAPLLTNPKRVGPGFAGSPMFQAETVLRTEKGRVYSMADRARMRQFADHIPGLEKRWLHSGNPSEPRPYHRDVLHGQVRPWNGYFDVNGLDAWGPHDPSLPPEEVIRCGCKAVPWMKSWKSFDTREVRDDIRQRLIDEWTNRYQGDG